MLVWFTWYAIPFSREQTFPSCMNFCQGFFISKYSDFCQGTQILFANHINVHVHFAFLNPLFWVEMQFLEMLIVGIWSVIEHNFH